VLCISVYLTVTIPALRTIVTPLEGVDTREDRIEAMRVLSAGNVMIVVGLGAILVLQVSDDLPQKTFHASRTTGGTGIREAGGDEGTGKI
jgi:hypothetical protein